MTLACLIHLSSFILVVARVSSSGSASFGNHISYNEFLPDNTYLESTWRRLVKFHGFNAECALVGQRDNVQTFLKNYNASFIIIDKPRMQRLLNLCDQISADLNYDEDDSVLVSPFSDHHRDGAVRPKKYRPQKKKQPPTSSAGAQSQSIWSLNLLKNLLILPGTKWCGAGDVAEHYHDLGYHADVDKCCRSHDLCLTILGEYLSPGQCRNGLCNFSPVTRSPCRCDREFVSCLHNVKTRLSNALGRVFFNIAGMTCYKYEHPVKRCAEFVDPPKNNVPPWILSATKIREYPKQPRCKRYELDTSKPKAWQFFDTFYEETNHRSSDRRRRRPDSPIEMFQQIFLDIFFKIVDPI